ncbi:phenylalanine--tRNA ligase subunit beta, partial [Candidatus Pacearchaeota archaeon]|nr:phenylalanine--tRNA ligase subunit beta [Candidatus Pacearchaeota archaeon]
QDLLSMQGFSRAILSFLEKKPGLIDYKVEKPQKDFKVIIEKSVKKVRPYTACAIVKNLKFTDEKILEIIEIQEKLHGSYGRNRKKLAVGIYPLEEIKLPIRFKAMLPEEIKFQPLEFPKIINGKTILSKHPTGREYGHLLEGFDTYPIFIDANNEILSMPPIINSEKTGKISTKTKDIFIECSGFNKEYLNKTLNMIVTTLKDMGGKIYSMEIEDIEKNITYLSPNLDPEKIELNKEFIKKTLGINLTEKQIITCLEKMNLGFIYENNKSYALIPPYRTDILHEIDIVEEIAIAYGYENFAPEIPNISTVGKEDKISILKQKISEIIIGLNMQEISSFHVSTKDREFKKLGKKEHSPLIEILDSKTENNILRTSLLSQSIRVLSENSDATYPQKIFELGKIFVQDDKAETQIKENENLCISLCHEKANFTEIKQTFDYIARMFDIKYKIIESTHPSFINGRTGEILINNKPAGIIGEISPTVLKNNKIKMPVASLELDIDLL